MRSPSTKFIFFNAAAAVIGVAALGAAARSILVSPTAAPCSERYLNLTQFSLDRAGTPLTPADLQASLNGRDVGVVENVAIHQIKNAPQPAVMGVLLRKAQSSGVKYGTSFPWEPRVLQGKSSVCISYQVLLPPDFDFHRGGTLPGLVGSDGVEGGDRFSTRFAWRPKGLGGATLRVSEKGATRSVVAEREGFAFPRGKWVRLEQEVVLNAPTKSDGVLRVWVDGTLAIDRTDMAYRSRSEVGVVGVAVDVFAGSSPDDAQAAPSREARVWLTSFEARW